VPRLVCTYELFIEIISKHDFKLFRHAKGSHQRWRREVDGIVFYVDIAPHVSTKEIPIKTLESMIRQSGLPKHLFKR